MNVEPVFVSPKNEGLKPAADLSLQFQAALHQVAQGRDPDQVAPVGDQSYVPTVPPVDVFCLVLHDPSAMTSNPSGSACWGLLSE